MAGNSHLEYRDWEATIPALNSEIDLDAVYEQTQRVLSDPLFHNSKRCSDLLKYIVDHTLDGQYDCLKERIIGIEIFERTLDYDTSVDSIVRGAAAEVRKRLSRYYQEPEHDRELRIELPIRSYIAEFKRPGPVSQEQHIRREHAVSHDQPLILEPQLSHEQFVSQVPQLALRPRDAWRSYLWIPVAVIILAFVAWGGQHVFAPTPAIDRFWAPMLNNSGPTLIALGSPVWIQEHPAPPAVAPVSTGAGMTLREYIAQQTNFPIADLSAANTISSFLTRHGKESAIRLSDSLTLSDLHGTPVIVLGSFPNEWAVRLGANLPFQFRHAAGLQWIEDTSDPSNRRWMVDLRSPYEQLTSEYSVITRDFNRTTGQWWIGVGGLTVLGTIATQQMAMDPKAMAALSAQLPKDWDRKNLQIVIETKMVKGSPGVSQVVATRSW